MLVLSRHRDESIIIGDDITITVLEVPGDKVRLGIAAPGEVTVHQQEVYGRAHEPQALSAEAKADRAAIEARRLARQRARHKDCRRRHGRRRSRSREGGGLSSSLWPRTRGIAWHDRAPVRVPHPDPGPRKGPGGRPRRL